MMLLTILVRMIGMQKPEASARTVLGKVNGGVGPTIGNAIDSAKSHLLVTSQCRHRLMRLSMKWEHRAHVLKIRTMIWRVT